MPAAILPVLAVALGAIGLVPDRTAIWLAFGVGLITLTAQGVRYAQLEKLSLTGSIVTITLNLLVGLTLVTAEVLIAH